MWLIFVALSVATAVPIEGAQFMAPVQRALQGADQHRVRITVLGDSHTVGDRFTGHLRARLQARFGEGARGFVLPGRPWRSHRQRHIKADQVGPWRAVDVRGAAAPWRGPGGCAMAGAAPESVVHLQPSGPWRWFDLHVTAGRLRITVDGTPLTVVGPGVTRVRAPEGARVLALQPDGPAEVLGVDFGAPAGVTVDALGINGARADRLLRGDAALDAGLRRMDPDLVVLAFGTNAIYQLEGAFDVARYQADFTAALTRVRGAARRAACLVVGPPDFQRRGAAPVPELAPLIEAQRAAAAASRCAFWDARAAMGGGVAQWARAGLAGKDHVHLTRAGYEALAEGLLRALTAGMR